MKDQRPTQRELKFRAWVVDKNRMQPAGSLKFWFRAIAETGVNPADKSILMQYTGLKDKNGVEIYEGDVLRVYFKTFELEDWLWLALPEEAKERGYFEIEVRIPSIYQNSLPEKIEVIGNIYENPELLKEGYVEAK